MTLNHYTLTVSELKKPIRLFQITDSHLTLCAETDSNDIKDASAALTKYFQPAGGETTVQLLQAMTEKAKELNSDCVILTGDIISYPSESNLCALKDALDNLPSFFYVIGNHDWLLPREGPVTEEQRKAGKDLVSSYTGVPWAFQTKTIGGVLLIGIDNSNGQVTWQQYEQTKEALSRGLPSILCFHVPLYTKSLADASVKRWGVPILMGCTEDYLQEMTSLTEKQRNNLRPTEATRAFIRLVQSSENLKALLTGHIHISHDEMIGSIPQYVTNLGAENCAAVFDLVP